MVRVKQIFAGACPSNLPCNRIVIEIFLDKPIRSFRELYELGIDFYDRAVILTPEQLINLLRKLEVVE